jgi:hypothetical protein
MYLKYVSIGSAFLLALLILLVATSCRKNPQETDAYAIVDKISLSYGNDRLYNGFTISNSGQKPLSYQIDENIDWLEVSNPTGSIAGTQQIDITCKVSRIDLPQGNYFGELNIHTSTGDFAIDVYMMVDMYLLTFINPVFTTIRLDMDTVETLGNSILHTRLIGKNDSMQFGFFSPPNFAAYYAQTSGRYTDSTQLGLTMEWSNSASLIDIENPRIFLDVSKAYFHLSVINNFLVLNPLFVNPGSQFEFVENIFIYQSSDPLPIGYYHALPNTSIRAYMVGSSSTVTWQNGGQFTLTDTVNQGVIVDNLNGDTTTMKSARPFNLKHVSSNSISRDFGDVFESIAREK